MNPKSKIVLLLMVALCMVASGANAHPIPPDLTIAHLTLQKNLIDMNLRGPAMELLGPAEVDSSDLYGPETNKPILDKLSNWLPQGFLLEQDRKPLTPLVVSAEYDDFGPSPQYVLRVHYALAKPAVRLRVTSKFTHTIVSTDGIQFELRGDKQTTHTFDTRPSLSSVWRNIEDFFDMGMEHLFSGPDHILFICTLIFALMDFRSVVKMLTGFTIGHSITLILTTFNVFFVPPRLADMGIAVTIIYVGLENIIRKDPAKNRWWLVFCFGLVHGMSFSSALKEVGLPQQGLVLCLLAFNLGIEIAQVIIVSGVYPILSRVRRYKEILHGEQGTRWFKGLMNFGSAFTASVGCYWLVERIFTH